MSVKQNFPTIKPTLNLDFAGSQVVDSRITFTRASAATLTDAQGILKTVRDNKPRIDFDPSTGECKGLLIEEQRTNIVTHLNSHGAVSYLNCFGVPYSTLAPDGTYSGLLVQAIPNPTSVTCAFIAAYAGVSAGQVYACSIYLKAGTNPGTTIFALYDPPTSIGYGNTNIFWSNGVPTVTNGATVTNAGNGWYRVTVLATIPSGQTDIIALLYPTGGEANKNVYCWNPQFELGSFSTSYISTASRFISRASSATHYDSTGVLRIAGTNQARNGFAYDTATDKWISQGLILEKAATNIVNNSIVANIGTNWQQYNTAVLTANYSTAPDGSSTAGRITTTNTGTVRVGTGGLVTSTVYAASIWVKSNTGSNYTLTLQIGDTNVVSITATPQWQRFSGFGSPQQNGYNFIDLEGIQAGADISVWGAQLETGFVTTSYIPTFGSSATRAADIYSTGTATRASETAVITGTNFSNWYNGTQGTLYAEQQVTNVVAGSNQNMVAASLYKNTSNFMAVGQGTGDGGGTGQRSITWIQNNNSTQFFGMTGNFISSGLSLKNAFAYQTNNFAYSANTQTLVTDSTGTAPIVDTLTIGSYTPSASYYANGHIKKIVYYPYRLSNTQLQALTV